MKNTFSQAVTYLTYPLLLGLTLSTIAGAAHSGWNPKWILWGFLFALLFILIPLEFLFPLSRSWGITRASFARDLKYLVADGITISAVRGGFGTLAIHYGETHKGILSEAPLIISVLVFLVVFEFFQYGFHRFSHEGKGALGSFFWRMHAAHHLPDRLYVVMHGVFHPLNALITALLIQVPMLLLGLSPLAILAVTLLIDLQTMISHFNVDIRAGGLNYLFIGSEQHRFHHSADTQATKNYGSVLSLWDLVFGTFQYRPGKFPERIGVRDAVNYPSSEAFLEVLGLPFSRSRPRPRPESN